MFSTMLASLFGEYAIYKFVASIIVTLGLLYFFRRHFLKIIAVGVLSIWVFIILFPKNELSDFVSKTVSEQTHNQHMLDFEDMSFSWNGGLAIRLDQVFFQIAGYPAMTLKDVIASPDLMSAINQKPYGRVKVSGLFNGDADISIQKHKPEEGNEAKEEQSLISVSANHLNIANLKSFLNLPFDLSGKMDMSAKIVSILQLAPPVSEDGKLMSMPQPFQLVGVPEMTLTVKNLDIPPFLLEKGMLMPVNIPGLKFSEVVFKGRIYNNTFQIEELQLGKPGDELSGKITGNVTLTKGPLIQMEKYDITTNLRFRQSFHDKISLYLSVLPTNPVRALPGGGYELKSKISGAMFGQPRFDMVR